MRIISGTARGKKILEPKDIRTRPLKNLTKEAIFNIINHSKKVTSILSGKWNNCVYLAKNFIINKRS